MTDLHAPLNAGLKELGLELPEPTRDSLIAYVELLAKWSKAYNLTAVRDPVQMVSKHLLDSLAVIPYLQGKEVIDIGCGAGIPGIPLSLCFPDKRFTLLDSNGKKTRFCTQAVAELGLKNVTVVQARAEEFQSDIQFETIITRAFASLADMLAGSRHLLAPGGEFLAMKGIYPEEELAELPPGFTVVEVLPLQVPGVEGARHLVRIEATQN